MNAIRALQELAKSELPEEVYGVSGKRFAKLCLDWYAAQKPAARDALAALKYPADMRKVPTDIVYRYVFLKDPKPIVGLLRNGKPFDLKSSPTSSWSTRNPSRSLPSRNNMITLVIRKKVRKADVALYTPAMVKANRWVARYWGSSTLNDIFHNGGSECEVILRNSPYWLHVDRNAYVGTNSDSDAMFLRDYGRPRDGHFIKDGADDDRVVFRSNRSRAETKNMLDKLNQINFKHKGPQGGGRYWYDTQESND